MPHLDADEHLRLAAVVLTLLRRLPTGLHAPRPVSSGSSLWAGVPTVGGEPDAAAATLRMALLLVFRHASIWVLRWSHHIPRPSRSRHKRLQVSDSSPQQS